MSEAFVFICTKQTYPLNVPAYATSEADHHRKVHNAFSAIASGFRRVGDLVLRPTSAAFDDHLLCDGSTLNTADFPQLAACLGATGATFTLPNYLSGLTFAASAPAQTVTDGGSVVIGTPTPTPTPTGGQTGGTGQNTSSGGRPRNPFERVP